MSKCTLTFCWVALMAIAGAHTAAAARWVKGYVVAFYDPAFRFGGRADYSRGTEIEPGVDLRASADFLFSQFSIR